VVVVIEGGPVILKLKPVDTEPFSESVSWNETAVVPAVVGIPVTAPVEAFSDNPAGSGP
jgi:hypothetical protein